MKKTFLLIGGLSLMLSACLRHTKLEDSPDFKISYTVPVKDSVFTVSSVPSLDLDKDGIADFSFSVETVMEDDWKYTHYFIEPRGENEILLLEEIDAEGFNAGVLINATTKANNKWSNQKGLLLEVQKMPGGKPVWTGSWSMNSSDKRYLPVRLKKNNKFHYGWIEMRHNILTEDHFIISATAIHELPDEEIKAGK